MNTHLVLDFNNLAHRASAKDPGLVNADGRPTGTVYGMLKMIKSLCHEFRPLSISLCLDSGLNPERLKFFPEYKLARRQAKLEKTPEEQESYKDFLVQKQRFIEYASCSNFKILSGESTEADDIIGYIANLVRFTKPFNYEGNRRHKIVIVSTDNDFIHTVSPSVEFYSPVKNQLYTIDNVDPGLELFRKSISGDAGDGVTGVPGVGEATILEAFKTIPFTGNREEFYNSCEAHSNNRVKKIGLNRGIVERNTFIISLAYESGFVRHLSPEVKATIKDVFLSDQNSLDYDKLLRLSHEDDFKSIYTNIKSFFWWAKEIK
jgi:DNA polymerase-1